MAISGEQRALRTGKLGSSDAPRLMAGRWSELWREKTGRSAPPNLDFVPSVQIGVATESLHARFYTQKTGIGCYPAGDRTYAHPEHAFIVAHLDFLTWFEPSGHYDEAADTILEAKFHGGYKTDEDLAEQYYWQLQHQMLVTGLAQAVLSILRPGSYSIIRVPSSAADSATLLETLRAFWWHVENDVEPSDPLPIEAPRFEQLRVLDMSFHNEFASFGGMLIDHRTSMLAFREAEAELKALMPEDARVAFLRGSAEDGTMPSQGLFLTRAKDGKLSLRFGCPPKKYLDKAEPWMPQWTVEAAE
ncbi:YqaJ viral recombinase family protein [Rhodospirillaceae bacterium SYSU D60014]|uniref:YqaJ viral recombinase family protein n=1 Tax=Virgifigura deserti TaxID=2268457 RepID=UPI0013C42368